MTTDSAHSLHESVLRPVEEYWYRVNALLGLAAGARPSCRRMDARGLAAVLESPGWLQDLAAALDGAFWLDPLANISANWRWRDHVPMSNGPVTSEVSLERAIADSGGTDQWCCQMPTLSGYFGKHRYKRRSIDLVWQVPNTATYRFIELKVDSDDVLYATFELLSYALTYRLARRHLAVSATQRHHVLRAQACELVVLAPQHWYSRCPQDLQSVSAPIQY